MNKSLIIYHRSDYDGTLSRDACMHWLLETGAPPTHIAALGWEYEDAAPDLAGYDAIYLVDISIAEVLTPENRGRVVWIDHHKTAIERFGDTWQGVRIDGVAACRLTWQWFQARARGERMPTKQDFIDRVVQEPLLLRMAGEYDVWDKREPEVDTLQYGLRSTPGFSGVMALQDYALRSDERCIDMLLLRGRIVQAYAQDLNAAIAARAYDIQWRGLKWLVINTAIGNSLTFDAAVRPDHDALLMWRHKGGDKVVVSLYGVPHHPEHDLSAIATKYPGGGGHPQACGFSTTLAEMVNILGLNSVSVTSPA